MFRAVLPYLTLPPMTRRADFSQCLAGQDITAETDRRTDGRTDSGAQTESTWPETLASRIRLAVGRRLVRSRAAAAEGAAEAAGPRAPEPHLLTPLHSTPLPLHSSRRDSTQLKPTPPHLIVTHCPSLSLFHIRVAQISLSPV